MRTVRQEIVVRGAKHWGSKPPAGDVGEILRLVSSAARFSVCMRFESRSTFPGAQPAWLGAASDMRFIGQQGNGDTTLTFDLPLLGDAAQALYAQQSHLLKLPDPSDTGLDLLNDVILDLARQDADSDRFDLPLLRRLGRFDELLDGSFESLDIISRRPSANAPMSLTRNVIESARRMKLKVPRPLAVRVYGSLTWIEPATRSVGLRLVDGQEVRVISDELNASTLVPCLQKPVTVIGRAIYRASGRLLRLDATAILPAREDERFFSKIPAPPSRNAAHHGAPPGENHGIAAIMSAWPGDENDAQIADALTEIS